MTEANVFQLSQPGTFTDPLTAVLRNGARPLSMLNSSQFDRHAEVVSMEGRGA